ncbi:non-ribosomal peptide synthetase [Saccharomonospora piscinae]|uniref:non-ribosomal peptide synthetase n=1 Tax=Saccharomonospora piscinae TaxID=687388 RepID=UPI0004662FAE|nr:non-ribosomal peptide synthetase [Saccharomonospora piscinae]
MTQDLGCRVAVYRVMGTAEFGRYERRLAEVDYLGQPHRLWRERVPGPAEGAIAEEMRGREVCRGTTSFLRIVLLEYEDDVHDLVLTAHPAVAGRTALDALARVLLGDADAPEPGSISFAPAGTAAAGPGPERERSTLHWKVAHRMTTAEIVAAVGLAHAWDAQLDEVAVRLHEGERDTVLRVRASGTVAGCRAAVAEQLADRAALDAPTVDLDLVVDRAARCPALLDYWPALHSSRTRTVHVTAGRDGALLLDHARDGHPSWFGDTVHRLAAILLDGPGDHELTALDRMTDAELRRVIALGRSPRTATSEYRCVPDLVRAAMLRRPEAVALVDGEHTVTYGQLVERAHRMGQALAELGVRRGGRVGVCLPRSADLVIVLLAVLTTGAAFVPMDPAYPEQRLRLLTADAEPELVVSEREWSFARTVVLRDLVDLAERAPAAAQPSADPVTPEDPAYVIYTSGSTGKPKGVVIPHGNVVRLLSATKPELGLGPDDTWTWFHSVAFDFSVWEIWGCLATGGRLVVVPRWVSRSPEDFHALLVQHRVTVLNQTPSAFTQLLDVGRDGLAVRLIVFGGEPLDTRMLPRWFDRHPESRCRLVNMFGITETTVHVTWHTVSRADALAGARSVGRPIPGWSVRIVDEHGRPLRPGQVGEIAVGGDGLALCYLGRPDLTADRFVTHRGERLYLSGDRGRLLPDGSLEHLGRGDDQVQLRGHRVEPEEIRAALLDDSAVVAAAVVHSLRDPADPATARLDAYVVIRDGDDGAGVRTRLAARLPEYMVPNTVTSLRSLPLTENGKLAVDRLPSPAAVEYTEVTAPPDASTLDTVLHVWRTVFRTEVGASDDFFSLGGNSLLAVRIARALRDHGHQVDARTLYHLPSPAELVTDLEQRSVR